MRTSRRILDIGLLLAAGIFLLSACGSGSSDSAAKTQQSSAAEAQAPGVSGGSPSTATGSSATNRQATSSAKSAEPVVIGFGEPVEIQDYIPSGQTTIVDFYSKYCPPCMRISPYLDKLDQDRDDITVIRVDINRPGKKGIDWGSPVARQFGLRSIPHFQIYGPDKKMIAEGEKAYGMVVDYIQAKS